jgi:hypothetical protein
LIKQAFAFYTAKRRPALSCQRVLLSVLVLSFLSALAGCGVGSLPPITPPSKPIVILFLQSPPTSLAVDATANIDAAVENSSSNAAANYTVTCGSAACGTFSPSAELGAVIYTAPATIPTGTTVTITAAAAADSTKSISATVTIVPPIPIVVSLYGSTPASMQVNSAVPLHASITNDVSANPQVKWSVTCGTAACGSFNPASTTSEAGTTYTAPASIPPGNAVTVTATSVTDTTKSASTTIVIVPPAPNLANGTYVFQLSGPAGTQANFITGVIVAQNGSITGGEQDSISYTSDDSGGSYPYAPLSGQITGGSYATTPDGNLQIALTMNNFAVETLNGVLAPGAKGFVAQLYGSLGSGTLDLQTSTTAPAGGYAISMYGGDEYADPAWIGGILNIDSAGAISGAGSVLDFVDEGNSGLPGGQESLAASTVSTADKFGRVQIQLNPGSSSYIPAQTLVGYIVDAAHIRLVSLPSNSIGNYQGAMGGVALGQGTATGQFNNTSITGSTYVFGAANATYGGTYAIAGALTTSAGGTMTGTLNWNDLGGKEPQTPISVTGAWTIDPTGRATLSNITDGAAFTTSLHLYLTGDGNALVLSDTNAQTFAGQAFQRQVATLTTASFSGTYALNGGAANVSSNTPSGSLAGTITAAATDSADTITGFADSGDGADDFAITGSFTNDANGILAGTITGLDSASRATADSFTLYLIDDARAIAIETDSTQLGLDYLQQQP